MHKGSVDWKDKEIVKRVCCSFDVLVVLMETRVNERLQRTVRASWSWTSGKGNERKSLRYRERRRVVTRGTWGKVGPEQKLAVRGCLLLSGMSQRVGLAGGCEDSGRLQGQVDGVSGFRLADRTE